MTIPTAGPPEAASADHADCGAFAGDAWLQALDPGVPSLPTLDNTYNTDVAAAINALGVGGLSVLAENPTDLNAYLAQWTNVTGVGIMAAITVNSWDCVPNPTGDARHWIDPYDTAVHFYNCWNATMDTVDPAVLQACYVQSIGCVRITHAMAKPSPATATTTITNDTEDDGVNLEPLIVHTDQGAWFLDEAGTYGVVCTDIAGSSGFEVVDTTADGYGQLVKDREAAFASAVAKKENVPLHEFITHSPGGLRIIDTVGTFGIAASGEEGPSLPVLQTSDDGYNKLATARAAAYKALNP